MNSCIFFTSGTHFNDTPCLSLDKNNVIFSSSSKVKKMVFIDLWNTVSHAFAFSDYSIHSEMKNGHFMPAPYTLYLARKAMGIFYIIHRCHHVSFLVCLHPIDPHCHNSLSSASKRAWYTFLIIFMAPFDTQAPISYFYLFSTTTKKRSGQKTY